MYTTWPPTPITLRASQMVFEAIKALKERNGSSLQAIKKYMVTTYPEVAPKFAPHQLRSALKKGTESGKFIKVSHYTQRLTPKCVICNVDLPLISSSRSFSILAPRQECAVLGWAVYLMTRALVGTP